VDCSGVVTARDALLVLQFKVVLLQQLPCPQNADVNGDQRTSSVDAALILQNVAGLLTL